MSVAKHDVSTSDLLIWRMMDRQAAQKHSGFPSTMAEELVPTAHFGGEGAT
jgi:hypothetical protein